MEKYSRKREGKWQSQYSEEFKRSVLEEYLNGTIPVRQLEKKHKLGNSRITVWLKEFGYEVKKAYFHSAIFKELPEMPKKIPIIKESTIDTEASLKKQLEDALILAEGYKRMIEIAEQDYKISIRKKSNTK
jgi:transposase